MANTFDTRPDFGLYISTPAPLGKGVRVLVAEDVIRRWEETMSRPRLPIVAVTASVMRDECESYLNAGMDDVLFKPFSAHALRALLLRYLPATQ